MNYTITPLTEHQTGAEVRGLDLRHPIDAPLRKALNDAFAQYHVLVFRDQKLTPAEFSRAGELFGDIMPQSHKRSRTHEGLEVYDIKNEQTEPGKYLITGETFHTDHSHYPHPPKATALHAVSLPSKGGDTQFVNMHRAYDDLPEDTKRRIGGLQAKHVFLSKYSPRDLRSVDEKTRSALPPAVTHPLVRTHPQNGRKFLYLNPVRIESITGMPDPEAIALIGELMTHATRIRFEYRHRWQYGDMVIWDNRSVMHQANGDYDMKEVRHLYRLMIKELEVRDLPLAAAG
ncbi:MAG: TauD/TfdA dioxygenase family protein [Burkholderiales bacterium]